MRFLRTLWTSRVLTSWISLVLKGGLVFFLLPAVALNFDAAVVSLWLLFFSFVTLGMILDFGFAPTFIRLLSYARADSAKSGSGPIGTSSDIALSPQTERLDLGQVLFAVARLYRWLPVVVVCALGGLGTLALSHPISLTDLGPTAWIAWGIVLASIGVALFGQMFAVYLQGMDRVDVFRRNEIAGFSVSIAASYSALIWFDAGFLAVVALSQSGLVLNTLLHFWQARRTGFFEHKSSSATTDTIKRVWADAWRVGLGVLAISGVYQGVGILLGLVLAPGPLATFLIGHRLIQAIAMFSNMPIHANIPRMSLAYRSEDVEGLWRLVRPGVNRTLALMVLCLSVLHFFGTAILHWISPEVAFPSAYVWAAFALLAMIDRAAGLQGQMNTIRDKIIIHIANGVTGVAIILLLFPMTNMFGSLGAVMAMVLPLLIFNVPYSAYHLLKFENGAFARFILARVFVFTALQAAIIGISLPWM